MNVNKSDSILIIGGGAWGLSSSLELIRNGYTNVTVVDPYDIPSPLAASNDVNKIVESPDRYTRTTVGAKALYECAKIAIKSWLNDPVFRPYYHQTGVILSSSSEEAFKSFGPPSQYEGSGQYVRLRTPEDFRKTMPEGVLTGPFKNWQGWYRKEGAGWCQSRKAIVSMFTEAKRLGVKFITGANGNIAHLEYDSYGKVTGARARNGYLHTADLTILSAGGYSSEIYDFEKQLRPTAWTLAHIKMEPEELEKYRDLPVLFNNEVGFFMEPDYDRGELKMCDEHPGYINPMQGNELPQPVPGGPVDRKDPRSIPFPRVGLPIECQTRLRFFLESTMPHLMNRKLSYGRICWDADTVDRNFLIDIPPKNEGLIVAVGASGHGVMNMPAIGKIVRSIIEGHRDPLIKEGFRWRPEEAAQRDIWDKLNRHGYGPYNRVMNFKDVNSWIDFKANSRL